MRRHLSLDDVYFTLAGVVFDPRKVLFAFGGDVPFIDLPRRFEFPEIGEFR